MDGWNGWTDWNRNWEGKPEPREAKRCLPHCMCYSIHMIDWWLLQLCCCRRQGKPPVGGDGKGIYRHTYLFFFPLRLDVSHEGEKQDRWLTGRGTAKRNCMNQLPLSHRARFGHAEAGSKQQEDSIFTFCLICMIFVFLRARIKHGLGQQIHLKFPR